MNNLNLYARKSFGVKTECQVANIFTTAAKRHEHYFNEELLRVYALPRYIHNKNAWKKFNFRKKTLTFLFSLYTLLK